AARSGDAEGRLRRPATDRHGAAECRPVPRRPTSIEEAPMDLTNLKALIPEHAKDLKLNVSTVLSPEGAPGLTREQILGTALAAAIAARNDALRREIEALVAGALGHAHVQAARAAAAIMAMNNVYYRFVHLVENEEYGKLPA